MSNKAMNKLRALMSLCRSIDGRKKFQKMVYILQREGINFPEKFRYHYYGPYSDVLQLEIDALKDAGYIDQEESRFCYTLKGEAESDEEISAFKELIEHLNDQDPQILELVATIYYIKEKYPSYSKEMTIDETNRLKPHLHRKIPEAIKLYDHIQKLDGKRKSK